MSKSDDLKKEAEELRKKSELREHLADVTDKASDDAVHRYRSEDLKLQAEKKEKQAAEAAKEEASDKKSSGLLY